MPFELRFQRALRFGVCVGVSLPADDDFALPPGLEADEAAYARGLSAARRAGWVGGRLALRAALAAIGMPPAGPILATARGAPALPPGLVGSVSHKRELAVALAAVEPSPRGTIGIDLEVPRARRQDISRQVLTGDERALLASLDPEAREAEVLRRFVAKEAIYKALDPWVQRFVSFQEVTLETAGAAREARLALSGGEGPFRVELEDASQAPLTLIAARVTRA